MTEQTETTAPQKTDYAQIVRSLQYAFGEVSSLYGARSRVVRDGDPRKPGPPKGHPLYEFQVEFCYIVDNILRGPECLAMKAVSDAKDLISSMRAYYHSSTKEDGQTQ